MWEFDRYDWGRLDAMISASAVPDAILRLIRCNSEADAYEVFDYIQNNIVVQGKLFEAAPPTAACLVIALHVVPLCARSVVLELLNHLCGGNVSQEERDAGYTLQQKSLQEVRKGLTSYLYLLQHGTLSERRECIDLLDMCASSDRSFTEQVLWYLSKLHEQHVDTELDKLIENTVRHLLSL